jgi:hypothetical protein
MVMVTRRTNYYITIAAKKVLSRDTLFSRALQEDSGERATYEWLNWPDSLNRGLPQERATLQSARDDQVEKLVGLFRIEASQLLDGIQGGRSVA